MRSGELRGRGLPIGSGVVDAACKNIVHARSRTSGMRWSQEGGLHGLDLRTRAKSGEWATIWSSDMDLRRAA